jgi:hypothetical protein
LRVTSSFKHSLDAAAEHSGRSQSQEAEFRLERSFSEEAAFGGAEMRGISLKMAAAFHTAGSAAAAARGNPEWTSSQWISDPDCYRSAMFAVILALSKSYPGADIADLLKTADGAGSMIEALKRDVIQTKINAQK